MAKIKKFLVKSHIKNIFIALAFFAFIAVALKYFIPTGHVTQFSEIPAEEVAVEECVETFDPETGEQLTENCGQKSINTNLGDTHKLTPSCPLPTVKQGDICILKSDVVIHETLELASLTHLNCKNHKIIAYNSSSAMSIPSLAIFINGAEDVKIQNCVIEGFDFGILAIKQKNSAQNSPKILNNDINVRVTGIYLMDVDNALITENKITYSSLRGRAIALEFDSDDNKIIKNTIVSTDAALAAPVSLVPGGSLTTGQLMDIGIHVVSALSTTLQNMIINGHLVQVGSGTVIPSDSDNDWFARNSNLIEENIFDDVSGIDSLNVCSLDTSKSCTSNAQCAGKGICLVKTESGIHGAIQINTRSIDTVIRGNTIHGWSVGVSSGGVGGVGLFTYVNAKLGICSLDATRWCVTNADCKIAPFGDKGTCVGAQNVVANGKSQNTLIEGNKVDGGRLAGIHLGQATNAIARRNIIRGLNIGRGINIVADGMLNSIVERNRIIDVVNGIALEQGNVATIFGAQVTLNDITGSSNADVLVNNGYALTSELSVVGKGNYWGLGCPGFDPAKVKQVNGAVNSYVTDSYPYGVPVAGIPDEKLPATCS